MNSLDAVEAVMAFEEAFDIELPVDDFSDLSPEEIVDRLELSLSSQRPNQAAAALLRKLAIRQNNPEIAEGLDGTWRWEQIAAIIREIFH